MILLTFCLVINDSSRVFAAKVDQNFCESNYVLYSCVPTTCSSSGGTAASTKAGGGGGGGCGGTVDENKKQIWAFLKSKGLTDDAAAGIMGNMEQESTFNPKATNGIGCRGVVQWCFGRNSGGPDSLESFAAEKGTSWDCLGTQLEFMWYEMTETEQGNYNGAGEKLEIPLADALNGKDFSAKSKYTKSGSYNAAAIFHDYFERANTATGEHLGRGERADEIYKEFTGQSPDSSLLSSSSSGKETCPGSGSTNGPIPSEECQAVMAEYKSLVDSGKITYYGEGNKEFVNKDLENCTTDQIECGTGGKGGVHPRIVRATVAAAKNSGASKLEQWNFNSGHQCDGLNHPRGMAIDIYCVGNKGTAKGGVTRTASEDCNLLFKYFYDHYDELGLTELIWQYPPPEYSCGDPKILCDIPGHTDHIHVGTRV